eukprot:XP_001703307.1 SEC7/BIG-like ARF-GEF [Chlamydomonas reinhardtii]
MTAQPDRAFEIFVKRTLSTIQKESWGRSKECKDLRDSCQNVLNLLHDHEQGHLQYDGSLAVAVLEPLYLAAASPNPKILEAALGCLHKLVAHAWLQGESSSGGQASDADVHFVAHGDCLLAAVRMVFNLALGAEDDVIKRTASNALLQMLNTIAKRVTAYQLFGGSSCATSRRSSLDGTRNSLPHSASHGHQHLHSHSHSAGPYGAPVPHYGHPQGHPPGYPQGYHAPPSRPLSTNERDVLLVLTAFCRLASREAGVTDIDKYLAAGKLLALELVVKVIQNPMHNWENVREEFARHMHQPLCLALLRNCSPAEPAAFNWALRLLTAVLLQPKLRKGLKLLVDLFVNYDCDLKAPNLFERTVQGLRDEAERFEAAKVTKSALNRGLSLFNGGSPVKAMRLLISSGVVENSPAGAAVFLRGHSGELDAAALGEYLGHHEDFELAAMRAYCDMERYGGMPIDTALRAFLAPFRLPGEAQKIDRLMEAFAERYVRDNPAAFRNADAAYVLAFAIIMLNTDAHNPLAERRLDRAGFVAMTSLPRAAAAGGNKLAAALGLRALVAPFRGLGGGGDRRKLAALKALMGPLVSGPEAGQLGSAWAIILRTSSELEALGLYARSTGLDGDAVVVFVRALCAVSREELDGSPPRLYSLNRLVEVAGANAASRIRLVWSRVWAVLSAHLVMAACHPHQAIAAQAVDALRGLAAAPAAPGALTRSAWGTAEGAMRPFVSVLRLSDDAARRRRGCWGLRAWRVMLRRVVAAVALRVPPALDPVAHPAEAAAAAAVGLPLESISAGFVARAERIFPLIWFRHPAEAVARAGLTNLCRLLNVTAGVLLRFNMREELGLPAMGATAAAAAAAAAATAGGATAGPAGVKATGAGEAVAEPAAGADDGWNDDWDEVDEQEDEEAGAGHREDGAGEAAACSWAAEPSAAQRAAEARQQLEALCRTIPAPLDPALPGSSWDHAVRGGVLARAILLLLHVPAAFAHHAKPHLPDPHGNHQGHHQGHQGQPHQQVGPEEEARRLALLPDVLALLGSHQPENLTGGSLG